MSMVLYEKEFKEINDCLNNLLMGSKSKCIFLVDKSGQLITSIGDTAHFDTVSLASLTAGNFAATNALAQLMGENEFSLLFHQGEKDNMHISVVEARVILVVIFDDKTSLGLIRLRVKNAIAVLSEIFKRIFDKVKKEKEMKTMASKAESDNRIKSDQVSSHPQKTTQENITAAATSAAPAPPKSETHHEPEQKTSQPGSKFDDDFQKKASEKIDNLFMD